MSICRTLGIAVVLTGVLCVNSLWAEEKTPPQAKAVSVPASAKAASAETVKDADGNIYHTVKIGNQVWTVENLRTTRFNDGTPIPNVTDDAGWKGLASPGFCYYENNPQHGKKYGALYNWYAASSDRIAPKGWRVPTHEEQMALRDYLIANGYNYDGTTEGNKVAKSMAAKTDWIYKPTDEGGGPVSDMGTVGKNPETNNRTGFSALPAGSRWNDGSFHAIGTSVYWWSTTPDGESTKAHMSSVHTWFSKYGNNQHHKRSGFCIRLIRDEDNKKGNGTTLQPASETQGKSLGNPDKIDVLIVTSGHHFNRESFFGIFKCDDIAYSEYTLKDESEVFEDISAWNHDVILLYNMTQKISPKRQENFVRLLKEKGIGLVVMHHAQAAFQSWREYHYIIGTAYIYFDVEIDGKPWPHGKVHEGLNIPISVMDDRHPITRGLKDFKIIDETYKGRWWAEGNHVLLTTKHPENDEPIAWTRKYGKAKVFNIQLGHDEQAHNCPEFRELVVRGIRWTAGVQQSSDYSAQNTGIKSVSVDGKAVQSTSSDIVKDADGNIYHTVKIGNQVWTVENLRTTKYNDGTPIPHVTDEAGWKGLASPGFCYYENKPEHGKRYGALYNWWAASSDKIAPKGWKVPTHAEQMKLRDYLIANGYNYDGTKEDNKVAKAMTAKTDWDSDPTPGNAGHDLTTNNSTGFTALPTGSRWNDGSFHAMGKSVYWWSTTKGDGEGSHMSSIHSRFAKYGNNQHHDRSGFCIRLLRDDSTPTDATAPVVQAATSIKGAVKNTSGACLAGARVKLESTGQSTTTDAKGNFGMVLAGLAPVTKTVTKEGYIDYHKDVVTITKEGYLDYQIHVPDQGAGEMAIEMIDCAGRVTDADGNVYQTVKIGDFVWTTTGLRTTKYNDGTAIPNVTDDKEWQRLSSPAWCYNENKPENGKNGVLYNWWAASHPKITPKGWHVPSVEEQLAFRRYLVRNGYNSDGTKYPEWKGDYNQEKEKENKLGKSVAGRIGWQYRITDKSGNVWEKELLISERPELNNKTGFNCLPNGARWNDGSFHNLTGSCYMWSTTPQSSDRGWLSSVHNWSRYLGDSHHVKPTGFGIRLLKDKN